MPIPKPANDPPKKFATIPVAIFAHFTSAPWFIKKILPCAELAVIYGEPGCGKSFLALDMAMSIAQGIDWLGHKTRQGRVIYLAAEGVEGFRKRAAAYGVHHQINLSDVDLQIIPDCPDFLHDQDVPALAEQITLDGTATLIFIDTFSRTMPGGDENSSKDISRAIVKCRQLRDLTGAMVVLIHHTGKVVENGARGWSGLKGAVDTEIEITKLDDCRRMRVSKQKDGADNIEVGFNLVSVELGMIGEGEDAEQITSMAVEASTLPFKAAAGLKNKPLGGVEATVWKVYLKLTKGADGPLIEQEALIEASIDRLVYDPKKRDQRRQRACRAIEGLTAKGKLAISGKYVSQC